MKQGQGIGKRLITLVLTIAMLLGLACTPIGHVRAMAAEVTEPPAEADYKGPVVSEKKADGSYDVTFYYYGSVDSVHVRSNIPGVGWDPGRPMTKVTGNVWSTTVTVSEPGTYHYKLYINDWTQDLKNQATLPRDGNSLVGVGYDSPEIKGDSATIQLLDTSKEIDGFSVIVTDPSDQSSTYTMHRDDGGLFTCELTGLTPGTYKYKFFIGEDYFTDPGNKLELIGDYDDCQFTIPEPVDPENFISPEINGNTVTFRYLAPNATLVWLAGDMTNWGDGAEKMIQDRNGVWSITKELTTGGHEYKFIVDNKGSGWTRDPQNPYYGTNRDSGTNNFVPVGYQSPVIDGSNVTITYYKTGGPTPIVAGNMDNWARHEMLPIGNNLYRFVYENLPSGDYEYKIIDDVNNDKWVSDPANTSPLGNDDNSCFTVKSALESDPPEVISPEVNDNSVTFRYDDDSASAVWLTGSMNGWATGADAYKMEKDSYGVWTVTLTLDPGGYEYKFLVSSDNGSPELDPENPYHIKDGSSFVPVGYQSPVVAGNSITITYYKTGDQVPQVAGSMEISEDNWAVHDMEPGQDGLYSYTYTNIPAGHYEYKIIDNNRSADNRNPWIPDPANTAELVGENKNSQVTVETTLDLDPDVTTTPAPQEVISPEINGHNVTFRYKDDSASKVELMGTILGEKGWEVNDNPMLTKNDKTGYWEITLKNVPSGKYEYKFVVNGDAGSGWRNDPLNDKRDGENNIVVITGLTIPTDYTIQAGQTLELPDKHTYINTDGNTTNVPVQYALKENYEGVTLENGVLNVPVDFVGDSITLTATHEKDSIEFTVSVFAELYTYNIYFFDWDSSRMNTNAADIWLWYDGNDGSAHAFDILEKIDSKSWLKATLKLPVKNLGLLIRSGKDYAWKTKDLELSYSEGSEEVNAYVYNNTLYVGTPPVLPDEQSRDFYVPGTFPGSNSWDAGSNKMALYDADRQIYSYTFHNVPPATYEFKIAVNGTWDPENYGINGEKGGGNYSVTVLEETDVTVYYSDKSHLAVTSVNYEFIEPTVEGEGISGAPLKLSDDNLTGTYSGKVHLEAGNHSGYILKVGGKAIGTFESFDLEAAKDVTFYYSPGTKVWYNDAVKWDGGAEVYYDTKNLTYKSHFGAVPTDTEITFSVDASPSITGVSLVVGANQYPMEKVDGAPEGKQRWSTTTTFPSIGEYRYYFIVQQLGGVKVYCDDDGYYGTGKLTDLTSVWPYDLVVYDKNFKTPDWMKNAVIYQIFPDRFFDGDPSNNQAQTTARGAVVYEFPAWNLIPENPDQKTLDKSVYESYGAYWGDGQWSNEIYGGDLTGITQKIEYLRDLGVTVIYLNPVFTSISSHRYDTTDYTKIDPILGDLEAFRELVKAAYANGMHIILDGVFNHVSDDSIYFDRYYKFLGKSEKVGAYPYWAYVYDYMAEHNCSQKTAETAAKEYFRTEHNITDFSYTTWFAISQKTIEGSGDTIGQRIGKPVYSYEGWWGYDSMPVIKSTNGSEFKTTDWANEVIMNQDSITRYWLEQGSNGWRLDVANEVSDETWQNFRDVVKDTGDCVIIGEIWNDATHYLLGDMYDSTMNYMFRNAVTAFAKGSSSQDAMRDLEKIRERYPEEAFMAMMNLVDSHDTARILSFLDGIKDDREQKDAASNFPSYAKTSDRAKELQKLVAFLQFTYAGAPTVYYGDERGMVGADDPDDRRTIDWSTVTDPTLLAWYQQLGKLRADYSALRTGSVEPIDTKNSSILGFVRRDTAQTIIVLANNSSADKFITLNLADLSMNETALNELISGQNISVEGGSITVTVPAYRGVVLTSGAANPEEVKPLEVPKYEEMDKPKPPVKPDPGESDEPSVPPTQQPSEEPTQQPSEEPTQQPSVEPTKPTEAPTTSNPPVQPSRQPAQPTPTESAAPQPTPSAQPQPSPSQAPSPSPSPSAPLEDLPDLDTPLSGLPAEVTHETTVRLDSTVKDGVHTAVLGDSLQDAILQHAKENRSTTIVVAPKTNEAADHTEVILPGTLVDSLAEMGGIDVRVETAAGTVTIPNRAMGSLADAKEVTVCVQEADNTVVVTVKTDGKTVETVPGGTKVALNLQNGQVAVLVDEDGNETILPKSLVEDGVAYAILPGSGTVKLETRSVLFQDVQTDSWYAGAVDFVSSHDLFSGISKTDHIFAPDLAVDRAMAATMLWALESKVAPEDLESFPDVADGTWYTASVAWASENGVVAGYDTGEFAPADEITREQFVLMMYNYVQYLGIDTSHVDRIQTFSDADAVSSWAREAMEWATGAGVVNGNGNQELKPKDTITRAEAAMALKNLIRILVK